MQAADSMGALLQYSTQGFVVNKRQRRMGGLAAIEFAQELQHLVIACLDFVIASTRFSTHSCAVGKC